MASSAQDIETVTHAQARRPRLRHQALRARDPATGPAAGVGTLSVRLAALSYGGSRSHLRNPLIRMLDTSFGGRRLPVLLSRRVRKIDLRLGGFRTGRGPL